MQQQQHYGIGAGIMVLVDHGARGGHTWYGWILFGVIVGSGTVLVQQDAGQMVAFRTAVKGPQHGLARLGSRIEPDLETSRWQRLQADGRRAFVVRRGVFG